MRARILSFSLVLVAASWTSAAAADPVEEARAFKACTEMVGEKLASSGPCYVAFGKKYPRSEAADAAWFNAAAAFEAGGDIDASIDACQNVVERYPKSRHVPDASNLWANLLERQGKLEAATRIRLMLVHRFPQHDVARDGAQAAIAWLAASDHDKELNRAIDLYVRYWSDDDSAAWVASMPVLRAGVEDCPTVLARAPGWLKRWGNKHHIWDDVALMLGRCLQAKGDRKGARRLYAAVVKRGAEGTLEASFRLADSEAPARLRKPGKRASSVDIKRWLDQRLARLGDDKKRYEAVLAHKPRGSRGGGERWRLAAIVRTGQIYERFAADLRAAPTPRSLRRDPEAEAAYKEVLEGQITPLEEKAVHTYSLVLGKAGELSVHDEYIALAYARLHALRPDRWRALPASPQLDPGPKPAQRTDKERGDERLSARRQLARQALTEGRAGDAIYLLQGMDDAESLNLYAVAAHRRGEPELALHKLRMATVANPAHPLAASNLQALRKSLGLPRTR